MAFYLAPTKIAKPEREHAMSTITLTAAMRANLLSLQGTAALLDQTQLRIATGNKVNSALDNPTSYFASQSLTNRSSDLASILDAMGQSISALKAADNGITELTSLVRQAQAIAQGAAGAVARTGGQSTSGDMSAAVVANLVAGGAFTAGDSVTLASNGVAVGSVTISAGETLDQLAASINALSGVTAVIIDGSSTAAAGSKRLQITSTSGETLTLTNGAGTFVTSYQANNAGVGGIVGSTLSAGVAGLNASGAIIAANGVASDYATREAQYNEVLSQIDQLVTDTGYQGINLLYGDNLKTVFNEKTGASQTSLTITGVVFDSAGLGLSAADFTTANTITASLDEITDALASLRSQASTFGFNLSTIQTRQDFTNNIINVLKEGSSKLILADKNEEAANMLSLQTSQQLGIQALSLASQANQSILRLFQ
jgi:flagellin